MLNKTYNIDDIFSDDLYPIIQSLEQMRERFDSKKVPCHIDGESELKDKYYPRFWEYASAIRYSNIERGMKILDAGSAYSLLSPFLTEMGMYVHANDVSVYWRERKKQMKELGKNFNLDIYDLINTRYPDEFFDRIFCISVIEHIPEDKIHAALLELNRVLKIGGIMSITFDYYSKHIPYGVGSFHGSKYCQFFSFESIQGVLLDKGFELIEPDFNDDTDWNNPPIFNQYNFARLFLRKISHINPRFNNKSLPVRVGHISYDFFYGGIQEQIQILTEYSENETMEHLIIACGDGPLHCDADLKGIPHAIINKYEIASFCEAYQVDIAFIHNVNGTDPIDHIHAYELFLKNIPLINVHYCTYKACYPKWLFDHIITNAHSTVEYLPKGSIYSIIPLAINSLKLDGCVEKEDIRKMWGVPDDSIVIGRLSRLEPTKMVDHAIIAMSKIKQKTNQPLVFYIGGSEANYQNKGWYEKQLKEFAVKENIGEIIFTGPLDNVRKTEFLHLLDINLAPTSHEGYGLIFVEPAYCGVPTVTYDDNANAEVVCDGGIIVPFRDIDKLVEGTITLIENSGLRKSIGSRAMQIVKSRNLPVHWCSAIESLICDKFILKNCGGEVVSVRLNRQKRHILISKIKISYLKGINLKKALSSKVKNLIKRY